MSKASSVLLGANMLIMRPSPRLPLVLLAEAGALANLRNLLIRDMPVGWVWRDTRRSQGEQPKRAQANFETMEHQSDEQSSDQEYTEG